ncbi:MAM and LDL-receptor class A domain-containing 2-like, partial [Paramuricea clavata]
MYAHSLTSAINVLISLGFYMYAETSSPRRTGDKARLQSPQQQPAVGGKCLEFWYHMWGNNMGSLAVYIKDNVRTSQVWKKSGNQGSTWQKGRVTLKSASNFKYMFEAVRGSGPRSDIAIDDVQLLAGPCPTIGACSFEGGLCQWAQDKTEDDFDWQLTAAGTPSFLTGPSTDHTFGNGSGYYVFIETSSPRRRGEKARLVGPNFTPSSTVRCLQFWYHMYGQSTGSLRVFAKWGAGNNSQSVLWSLSGSQGNQWKFGRVSVSRNDAYRFVFEGTVGSSYTGDIALDDIQIVEQACSILPVTANINPTSLPTTPVVSTPQPIPPGKFSCNFEVSTGPTACKWTQDSSDHFNWTRHQGHTASSDTGPTTDHTKGVGLLANKNHGPGSIQHRGGKCIHILLGGYTRPKDGQPLVVYRGCGQGRLEFQLFTNGTLMHTRHSMCVKPIGTVTDGAKVGVHSNCDLTDKWSWTAKGSLKFKNKYCLKPETGWSNPGNNIKLVIDSACDNSQNFFKFVPTRGWYLYIETSSPRKPNDTARFISPLATNNPQSCLHFYYHMYGPHVGKLQVYVKSGGKMGLPVWSHYGTHGNTWYQAQVAVNNQKTSYQYVIEGVRGKSFLGDIAIDDIYLKTSCSARDYCSFEEQYPQLCGYTRSTGRFQWLLGSGSTSSVNTGPSNDHTLGDSR